MDKYMKIYGKYVIIYGKYEVIHGKYVKIYGKYVKIYGLRWAAMGCDPPEGQINIIISANMIAGRK